MNILQRIFTDYYEQIEYTFHPRPSEMENIEKMINCGDPSFGGAMYGCSNCGKLKFVPFRCHSRFCPTCGNIVFSILLPALFHVCSLKWTNPETSLPAISWFSILLAGISNGIPTSTVWSPKAATAMMAFGVISLTLIIHTFEMLFALHCLTKWKAGLVPLSKRLKPYVILNTNKASMFMSNLINVILNQ